MPKENDYIPWPIKGYSVPQEWLPAKKGDVLHDGLVSGLGVVGATAGGVAGKIGGGILGGAAGSAIAGPPGAAIGIRGGSIAGGFAGSTAGGLGGAWLGHAISEIPEWLDEAPAPPKQSRQPHSRSPVPEQPRPAARNKAGKAHGKTASAREQAKAVLSMSDEAFSRIPGRELDRILRALG